VNAVFDFATKQRSAANLVYAPVAFNDENIAAKQSPSLKFF